MEEELDSCNNPLASTCFCLSAINIFLLFQQASRIAPAMCIVLLVCQTTVMLPKTCHCVVHLTSELPTPPSTSPFLTLFSYSLLHTQPNQILWEIQSDSSQLQVSWTLYSILFSLVSCQPIMLLYRSLVPPLVGVEGKMQINPIGFLSEALEINMRGHSSGKMQLVGMPGCFTES